MNSTTPTQSLLPQLLTQPPRPVATDSLFKMAPDLKKNVVVQNKSPLFLLARELRDQIYHFAFEGTEFRFTSLRLRCKSTYTYDEEFALRHRPRWMLASKQLLDEALKQHFVHAKLTFHGYVSSTRSRRNSLLPLHQFRSLHFNLYLVAQPIPKSEDKGKIMPMSHEMHDVEFESTFQILVVGQTSMQNLEITVEPPEYSEAIEGVLDWKVDLSLLKGLPKTFKRIHITMGNVEFDTDGSNLWEICGLYQIMFPTLQEELIRTAMLLMSGSSQRILFNDFHDEDNWNESWRFEAKATRDKGKRSLKYLGLNKFSATIKWTEIRRFYLLHEELLDEDGHPLFMLEREEGGSDMDLDSLEDSDLLDEDLLGY